MGMYIVHRQDCLGSLGVHMGVYIVHRQDCLGSVHCTQARLLRECTLYTGKIA